MSRFRDEVRVIPRTGWGIALGVFALLVMGGAFFFSQSEGPRDAWPWWLVISIAPFAAIFSIYVLLVGYVYADARRRGMRYGVWTLIAIFVPNGVGIILYFLLREPMLRVCPACGGPYRSGLAYCPACGNAVTRICLQCKCPLEDSWKNCAHCGVLL